jgi:hypothetical protein
VHARHSDAHEAGEVVEAGRWPTSRWRVFSGWTISSTRSLEYLHETGSSTPDRKPRVFRSLLFITSPSTPALEHPQRLCLAQRVHTTATLPALVALVLRLRLRSPPQRAILGRLASTRCSLDTHDGDAAREPAHCGGRARSSGSSNLVHT